MKEKIKQFMEQTFLFEFDHDVTETSDLFKHGVMDSFGYIQLLKYLEREFGIAFSEDEMLSGVLVTFSSIVDCVSEKVDGVSL